MNKRTFSEIASEVKSDWKNIYFGAEPYLHAMSRMDTSDPNEYFGWQQMREIVLYFLSNAERWRGATARRVKQELIDIIKK